MKEICFCAIFLLCYIWGFSILSVLIYATTSKTFAFTIIDDSKITQIRTELETQPFVDIKAVKLNNSLGIFDCPVDYPVEVLHQMWMGATLGCDCRRKMYNYSLKKRDDGQFLPINSYEMKPSKYIGSKGSF